MRKLLIYAAALHFALGAATPESQSLSSINRRKLAKSSPIERRNP